jgi:tellurite resistance protein TehA-like permease
MFPTGIAGIGLLILRVSMAAVLVDVAVHPPFTTSFWGCGLPMVISSSKVAVETGKE